MGVDLGSLRALVTQQLLNVTQVCSTLKQVCGKAMPQCMDSKVLGNARPLSRLLQNLLRSPTRQVSSLFLPWKEPVSWAMLSNPESVA